MCEDECSCQECNGDETNLNYIKEHSSGACQVCHSTDITTKRTYPLRPLIDSEQKAVCNECGYNWTIGDI